ncbi:MAG: hypothetical protein L7R83_02925 [Candidatus Poseidonia sp.]|nr:hypothetical protein [Poseidonia sp.]
MRRGTLAICLIASMLLAGCFGPSTADWGTGPGTVQVDFSMEQTTVKSTLSGDSTSTAVVPVGCIPGTAGGDLQDGNGSAISFTGYLAASAFYDSHNQQSTQGLGSSVTTAVAVQSMSFSEAAAVVDGEGSRIDLKDWSEPLYPRTGPGSVNLEKIDDKDDTRWFVLGLIPTSESVLKGMTSLNEWHQPVSIHGYLVDTEEGGTFSVGKWSSQEATNECSLKVDRNTNRENLYVLVTGITLDGATVSANGEADDEWVQGDVPFLGRGGFIMFFLVAGLGGAVGLFIVSKGMLMKSAGRSMRILIGDEGMKRAESVKTDAKAAKKAGMESPTQRQERLNRERKKEQKKERSPVEEAPKKASSGDALGGFDLDSVLASTSSSSSRPGGGAPPGRKSSVVEATNSDIIVQNITYNIQDSAVAGDISPPKPPVRRRKAVKKAPSEPVEEEAPPVRQFEDEEEEEFSDFSF